MKLKLTALLLVLYTGLYAQNKIVLTAPRLDTSSLSNRINLKANTNLNNVNGVLSSTYGGAGSVSGILKADGSGVVSPVIASDITTLISGTYLPLSAGSGNVITGTLYINSSLITSNATYLDIYNTTSDGSDTKITRIGGGGDVINNRGANIDLRGNEAATGAGNLYLNAGGSGTIIANATLNGTSAAFSGNVDLGFNNNLRLGTSQYYYKLTRSSTGQLVTYFDDEYDVSNSMVQFRMRTAGTPVNALSIFGTGNIGIKTTTDNGTDALQVAGSVRTTGAITASSSVTANSFVKSGGTSSQYLMADGSTLNTSASIYAISLKTANYTLTSTDYTVIFECTSGNLTATLPAGVEGKIFIIKKLQTNATTNSVTITPNGSDTIEALSGSTDYLGVCSYGVVMLQFLSGQWRVINYISYSPC